MTPEGAAEAVVTAFLEAWDPDLGEATPAPPVTAYTLDNTVFEAPENAPWARMVVRHLDQVQDTLGSIGNRKFRSSAIAVVQVYVPVNAGSRSVLQLAQQARSIFLGRSLAGGLDFVGGVPVRETGVDGKWFGAVVEAPFNYDEVA